MHKVILPFTPNFQVLSGGDSRGDPERGAGAGKGPGTRAPGGAPSLSPQMRTQARRVILAKGQQPASS